MKVDLGEIGLVGGRVRGVGLSLEGREDRKYF